MPFAGGTRASVALALDPSLAFPAGVGGALSALAAGFSVCALDGAAAAPPIETRGVILSMVFAGTPALARSPTDEYGRPAMIFFAVAAPTPGSFSSSACVAALRSTLAPAGALLAAHPSVAPTQLQVKSSARTTERTCAMAASLLDPRRDPICA